MEENIFQKRLLQLYKERHFVRFDEFIVHEFITLDKDTAISEEIRKTAYHNFYEAVGRIEIAALNTMKRWFGISGYSKPDRVHIFHMAFLLGLEKAEVERYLTQGLNENSFQINDYHEMIYLYGVENHLTFEQCQQMISIFEKKLSVDQKLSNTRSTKQLYQQYEQKKMLPMKTFLLFMTDNVTYFKGYSNTALTYLIEYRNQVLQYIRIDAEKSLKRWLEETDYYKWKNRFKLSEKQDTVEIIQKYVKKKRCNKLTEEEADIILELSKLAYSPLKNNSLVYSEIFSNSAKYHLYLKDSEVRRMTMKRMSDLFNIAGQREQAVRVRAAIEYLEVVSDVKKRCPADIEKLLINLTRDKVKWSCAEALRLLQEYEREHRRRMPVVSRSDLLPFVLYVMQQKYLKKINGNIENYECESAKEMFRQAADSVLTACSMPVLSDKWELDVVLLSCFQKEGMYGYSDVLEALYE